jgi:ABC-type antimicrobial peptide transport system permease subunit
VYFPYAQHPLPRMALVVRAYGDPAGLFRAIRGQMSRMHPSVPLARAETMDEAIAQMKAPDRLITLLVACCAGLAILLAAVGIYAVMSYSVAERTREIGVRIALGARPFDVVALIVRQGGLVTGIGLLAGWALSMMFSHVLQALLYGVGPHDPATLAAAAGFLATVAMIAIVVPALKAARCDPVVAIRSE